MSDDNELDKFIEENFHELIDKLKETPFFRNLLDSYKDKSMGDLICDLYSNVATFTEDQNSILKALSLDNITCPIIPGYECLPSGSLR